MPSGRPAGAGFGESSGAQTRAPDFTVSPVSSGLGVGQFVPAPAPVALGGRAGLHCVPCFLERGRRPLRPRASPGGSDGRFRQSPGAQTRASGSTVSPPSSGLGGAHFAPAPAPVAATGAPSIARRADARVGLHCVPCFLGPGRRPLRPHASPGVSDGRAGLLPSWQAPTSPPDYRLGGRRLAVNRPAHPGAPGSVRGRHPRRRLTTAWVAGASR